MVTNNVDYKWTALGALLNDKYRNLVLTETITLTGPAKRSVPWVRLHHQHHQRRGGVQHQGWPGEQTGSQQD